MGCRVYGLGFRLRTWGTWESILFAAGRSLPRCNEDPAVQSLVRNPYRVGFARPLLLEATQDQPLTPLHTFRRASGITLPCPVNDASRA